MKLFSGNKRIRIFIILNLFRSDILLLSHLDIRFGQLGFGLEFDWSGQDSNNNDYILFLVIFIGCISIKDISLIFLFSFAF